MDSGRKTHMTQRIDGFDVARALAVFGMVVVNFKIATGADQSGPHPLLDLMALLEGRAAATFVVLAGVGLSLLSARARAQNDLATLARQRVALLKRALFLLVVGLFYTPIWPADILHFYGVYITVGALLLAAPRRHLIWAAAGCSLMFVVLLSFFDYEQGWDWETLAYDGLWTPQGMVRHLFFNGFHPVFPWTAFLLLGMVLGRLNLRDANVRRRTLWTGVGIAAAAETLSRVAIGVFSKGASAATAKDVKAVFGTAPMPPMPLYVLAGGGVAVVVITACVGLTERHPGAPWLRPLISTGQLALTLYVAHVLVGMGTLEALGRLGGQSAPFAALAAMVFSVLSVFFAHLWRRRFQRGPVEWVMRRVTS